MEGFWTRIALRAWTVLILLFLFIPILLIFYYAFNTSNIESWPIRGLTLKWFSATWNDPEVRTALVLSIQAGLGATAIALVLGSEGRGLARLVADRCEVRARIPLAGSIGWLEARFAEHLDYAWAMALTAATVFILGTIVAQLGPERRGVAFGRGAPYP